MQIPRRRDPACGRKHRVALGYVADDLDVAAAADADFDGHTSDPAVIDHLNRSPATASAGTTIAAGFSRKMILTSTDMPIRSGVSCGSRK